MENNKIYKCGICGKAYNSVQERMNCELTCIKRQKAEEKRLAEEKKNTEKLKRFADASRAVDDACALVNKCIEDYGSFQYKGDAKNLNAMIDFFPSKLAHHFWF